MFSNACLPSHKKWDPKIQLHFCKDSFCSFVIVIHHFHIDHNTPCLLLKILHNRCFLFLLGQLCYPGGIGKGDGGGGEAQTRVAYHLQKGSAKSGWKVNRARLSGSFQRKISGSNGISVSPGRNSRSISSKPYFIPVSGFRCRFSANVADLYKC